ncbi:FMN-binding protein [Subtercola vilae]|uniref:FMN-binding protein n=1 Tax=Subtercola vilae TaxID=2056433 RepID=A0A4T2BWB9_9MICO|nr:FMN-binding protein [Subtercola vilae]
MPQPKTSAPASAPPSIPAQPAPAAPAAPAPSNTFTGSSVSTPYGNVQVKVTVDAGKITDVTPLHLTDDGGRSVQISNRAAPILQQEILAAQSANVDSVSGATYTSDGYLKSLQSALDQAGR